MLPDDPAPRIAPLKPDETSAEAEAFIARWLGESFQNPDTNPVLLTFAHHPQLADVFSQFNIHLLRTNTVPVKLRQIAIMRTAWICGATYMWSSHLNTSVRAGLEPDFFRPVQMGAEHPYFNEFERVVIRATEELVHDRKIGDDNWRLLSAEWDHQQMLDFMFTVGTYAAVAGVMRSIGVQRDAQLRSLAEKYGAPDTEGGNHGS